MSTSTAAETSRGTQVVRTERALVGLLGGGAALSVAAGVPLWLSGRRRSRANPESGVGRLMVGVARQGVAWGMVDAAIAGWSLSHVQRGQLTDGDARRRARRMAVITGLNAVADMGYLAGGVALVRRRGSRWSGRPDGVGVLVQAAFLLWLDTRHARQFAHHARAGRSPGLR